MSRLGDRNDWWDWGVILLLVAGGTFLLWVSVWLVRSELATPRGSASALDAPHPSSTVNPRADALRPLALGLRQA